MKPNVTDSADHAANEILYDQDFFAWTQQTAALLRSRRFAEVDLAHAAEELEDMGKRDLRELNNRTRVLLMHLLKWTLQPEKRSTSWQSTIIAQRVEIEAILEQSPSLRAKIASRLPRNYAAATKRAVAETGLRLEQFPGECPFSVEQILDEDFLPA